MNLVFIGTGKFAVPALEKCAGGPHKVLAVVTQPDRPAGRGLEIKPSPVKEAAAAKGIHLFQPEDINEYEFIREVRALGPDVIVVVAYGQKIGNEILELPRWCCVNIHPSLLPRYRGPAPVARAILNGERVTGVCVVKVVEKMDAGPVFGVARYEIPPDATTPEVEDVLSQMGAELLLEVLDNIRGQTVVELPQNDRDASYARKFEKGDGRIDWGKPSGKAHNFIRALQPFPGAFTFYKGHRVLVWRSKALRTPRTGQKPGTITAVDKELLRVSCGDGELEILEIQPENKKRMTAAEFINGHQPKVGEIFG
jgi:methionyl-tRNA formyltransferase